MPRTSQAALAVLPFQSSTAVEIVERLKPPDCLDEAERTEFIRIVNEMPAENFWPGNMTMLIQLCRHIVLERAVSESVKKEACRKHKRMDRLLPLLQAQGRETRMISQLMTSLRMTPASTMPNNTPLKKSHQVKSPMDG